MLYIFIDENISIIYGFLILVGILDQQYYFIYLVFSWIDQNVFLLYYLNLYQI